jgi:hypothetical protein
MAKKTYSKKSHLENIGELWKNQSGSPDERGNGLPREAVALLETISGPESGVETVGLDVAGELPPGEGAVLRPAPGPHPASSTVAVTEVTATATGRRTARHRPARTSHRRR